MSLRLLFLSAALLCALAADLAAQTMTQVIESLSPSQAAAATQSSEPTASEQLTWAGDQAEAARQRVELAQSEGFKAKIESAGLPPARGMEILREAGEAVDLWISAQNLLEWIVTRESLGEVSQEPPAIPADTSAALALESENDELKNQLARIEFESSAQASTITRAEQQQRSARRDLAELHLEAEAPLTAAARDRSDVEILQATIRENAADAVLFTQRWLKYRHEIEAKTLRTRSDAIRKVLESSGYHRLLNPTRASAQIQQIEATLPDLEKQEQEASAAFDKVSAQLTELRAKAEAATAQGNPPPADLQKQLQNALAEFSQQEALRSATRAHSMTLRHTSGLWSRVLELVQNPTLDNLRNARADLDSQLPNTSATLERIERILADKRANGDRLRHDLRMPGLRASERELLQKQIDTNQKLTEKLLAVQSDVSTLRAMQNRLTEEIDAEIAALLAQRQWRAMVMSFYEQVRGVWNFQITEQGNRTVTLGTILTALFALVFAIVIARFVAKRISLTAEKRLRLGTSQTHLIEKLTLYVLSVLLVLTVLQWLQIPLTIFAFLGGALAVGIGFGSQNLINNFISGLLLLLERKINVGDLVEVDNNFGRVINLGSRCSAIRKFDGVEVLVPNSALLEQNVVNWTLSDPLHRYDFRVSVAYGSDVELVIRTLREAVDAQPELAKDPEPEVAFEDFGDSNLIFHVYYWLIVGGPNPREVGTEMRVRICRLFKERNIEMAFPQRDVNLSSLSPIEVRLRPSQGEVN